MVYQHRGMGDVKGKVARAILFAACIFVFACQFAWADATPTPAVPEASALLLAPVGLGAVAAVRHRRRRRLAAVKRKVGAAYQIAKRVLDITLASLLLLALSPLFAVVALLVRLDSPGPVLFRRRVIGKHGQSFDMFKFRSMVEGAEEILARDETLKDEYYVNCKLRSDPRVTRLGKFLRKTSLDELPQLLNVILGNMAFVGPRPIHADEVDVYGPQFSRFKTVKPGITGLWQTRGRSNTSYEERVKMDMLYIEQRSVLLDIVLIACTIPAVLLKRGAF